jgi:two-component system, NarL family, response regulator NreC
MKAASLSPRETTVLHFIVWGYTNKEIAHRLGLSVKTIEAHKHNGMAKLKLPNRAVLVRFAVDHGWMMPDAAPDTRQESPEAVT